MSRAIKSNTTVSEYKTRVTNTNDNRGLLVPKWNCEYIAREREREKVREGEKENRRTTRSRVSETRV